MNIARPAALGAPLREEHAQRFEDPEDLAMIVGYVVKDFQRAAKVAETLQKDIASGDFRNADATLGQLFSIVDRGFQTVKDLGPLVRKR